jgi:hypothetical protein
MDQVDGILNLILVIAGLYYTYKFLMNIRDIIILYIYGEESEDKVKHII